MGNALHVVAFPHNYCFLYFDRLSWHKIVVERLGTPNQVGEDLCDLGREREKERERVREREVKGERERAEGGDLFSLQDSYTSNYIFPTCIVHFIHVFFTHFLVRTRALNGTNSWLEWYELVA